jgi:hypothetical protein
LLALVGRRVAWQEQVSSLRRMRAWVLAAEHLLSGEIAPGEQALTNATVAQRFDQWLDQLAQSRQTESFSEHERQCLQHFLQTTRTFRPHLILCYEVEGLPRTNNETERYIRSLKTRARRMSGRKNWNSYLLRYGRYIAYYDCLAKLEAGEALLEHRLKQVSHQQWRVARSTCRIQRSEQLKIWRFRHKRDQYLHTLELRWQATANGT